MRAEVECGARCYSQNPPLSFSNAGLKVRAIQNRIAKYFYDPISRQNELAVQFFLLTKTWKRDTSHLSSVHQICAHPSYLSIIAMGEPVVPLILSELKREPNHWFWALEAITRTNPIKPEHRGKIRKMAEDWISWGKEQNLI
jgi:hypothetical protein